MGILGVVAFAFLVVTIVLPMAGLFLFFFSFDKSPFPAYSRWLPRDEQNPDPVTVNTSIVRAMLHRVAKIGFMESFLEPSWGRDPRYSFSAKIRDIRRDPDIRWQVLLTMIPQFVFPGPPTPHQCSPVGCWGYRTHRMEFPIINAYVLEQLLSFYCREGRGHTGIAADFHCFLISQISQLCSLARRSPVSQSHRFTYGTHPRLRNPLLRNTMKRWSVYDDADSTLSILALLSRFWNAAQKDLLHLESDLEARIATLLGTGAALADLDTIFAPMRSHMLPVAQQAWEDDPFAYLEYYTTGPNDADPAINVNILYGILTNWERWDVEKRPATLAQIRAVFDYLHHLAGRDLLFHYHQHQYYPLPVFAFIWRRFSHAWAKLPACTRQAIDIKQRILGIETAVCSWLDARSACSNPCKETLLDSLLLEHARPFPRPDARDRIFHTLKHEKHSGPHELFCAVYPLRIAYGSPLLEWSLFLNL